MRLLGNILWFILGGWWNFLVYSFLGVLFCITIIGIPIGKSLFQYAKLMALPFGKVIVKETDIKGKENVAAVRRVGGLIANIIWLPFGIVTFIANIGLMIGCAITIIGIPAAIVIAKSCTFLLWPVGAKVITKEEAEAIRMERMMVKVAGTAVAVGAGMTAAQVAAQQTPQAAIPATSAPQISTSQTPAQTEANQTLENLKAGGAQVFGSIKETSGKAATAIAQTSQDGMTALKNRQMQMCGQVLAQKKEIGLSELLTQLEVKLCENKIMAWIMPFLEYITLAVGIVFIIFGMVSIGRIGFFPLGWRIFCGVFYGITIASPILLFAEILGMIKQKHIFVLITLGVQLIAHLILGVMGLGFSFLEIITLIGVIVWYVLTFVKKIDFASNKPIKQIQTAQNTASVSVPAGDVSTGKYFCSQCGAECSGQVSFCPKCGNKLR